MERWSVNGTWGKRSRLRPSDFKTIQLVTFCVFAHKIRVDVQNTKKSMIDSLRHLRKHHYENNIVHQHQSFSHVLFLNFPLIWAGRHKDIIIIKGRKKNALRLLALNEHLCLTSEQKFKTDFTSLLMEYAFTKVLDIDKYYTLPE